MGLAVALACSGVVSETKLNGEVTCEIAPWIAGEFGRVVEGRRMRSALVFRRLVRW